MPDLPVLCCTSCGCRKSREDFIKNGPKRTLLKTCQACRRVGLSLTDFAAADTLQKSAESNWRRALAQIDPNIPAKHQQRTCGDDNMLLLRCSHCDQTS